MKSAYMIEFGYEPLTTFWQDFTIADKCIKIELNPIQDTYKRALDYAKTDYKYFTELSMVLNHKLWQHHEQGHDDIAKLYEKLWFDNEDRFYETFGDNEEATHYYYTTLD